MEKKTETEIDLIKIFEIFWQNKFKMIFIIFLSLLISLGINFSNTSNPQYKVSVPYSVLYHPVRVQDLCNNDFDCMRKQTSNELKRFTEPGWVIDSGNGLFLLITEKPMKKEKYSNIFNEMNNILTEEIYKTAINDLRLIENSPSESITFSETLNNGMIRSVYLKNQRLIYSIENGQTALFIGEVKIRKQKTSFFQPIFLSLVLGGIISIFYVLIYNSISKRKTNS